MAHPTKGLTLSTHNFPAAARTFTSIATPTRSRIFLISNDAKRGPSESLTQVATITGPAAVSDDLVRELNRAAWTGNRSGLDELLAGLPEPVIQACEQALGSCPNADLLALGFDDQPMTVLKELYFSDDPEELAVQANAAMDLGLQWIVSNYLDEDGQLAFTIKLLSDECQFAQRNAWSWWSAPDSQRLVERFHPHPQDLAKAFSDNRWGTNVGRAYWMWIEDGENIEATGETSATATWVFEFFDELLSPDTNFRIFHPDDGLDEESRGVLTPRNRFILWLSLWNIAADLDGMLSMQMESSVRDDLPGLVGKQPQEWWEKLRESADRLVDAARKGGGPELAPRTVGEEALIALATRPGYIAWAQDSLEMFDHQQVFDSLPASLDDGEWGEILPELTGDADVEMLWHPGLDGIGDPGDIANRVLGMGDYRPGAWHTLFARAKQDRTS